MHVRLPIAFAFTVVLFARSAWSEDPGIGSPAPSTSLPDGHGHPTALVARPGTVLVVDFFATWCGPCHQALDALTALAPPLRDHVTLVVIAVGETREVVEAFFRSRPLPSDVRVVFDRRGEAAQAWGQHRFPTTFLVDASGVIRHINRGYGPGYPARIQRWLEAMSAPPRGAP